MHPFPGFLLACSCAFILMPLTAGPPTKESRETVAGTKTEAEKEAASREVAKESVKPKKEPPPFAWVNPLPQTHHPALEHETFRSSSLRVDVGYCILLPPRYSSNPNRRYPVVYYLHGGRPGSESKSHRLAGFIHDAMVSGQVRPMIYVFVNGGPVSHYNMPDQPRAQGVDVFTKELIPHIDAKYRTIANRRGRALEGFSQGGRGTMRISLRHPDLFVSAAAGGGGYETEKRISESGGYENDNLKFSAGDNTWDLARAYAADGDAPKVRWLIYVGTKGFNYENNLDYMKFLSSLGIEYRKLIVPDVPHSATGIYETQAIAIMSFHAKNF